MTVNLDLHSTVGAFVTDRPARSRVFESLGIDYCCGGKVPLDQVCRQQALNTDDVLARLLSMDNGASQGDLVDVASMTLTELANHIEHTHHAYLTRELPRLAGLMRKVVRAHGDRHAWLASSEQVFLAFVDELTQHMMKEERVLFPAIRRLESVVEQGGDVDAAWLAHPIGMMEHEHDQAGDALATLHELSGGYIAPDDACNTFRALLDGLRQLEADMHQHVHKENNVLFPKALALEGELTAASKDAV